MCPVSVMLDKNVALPTTTAFIKLVCLTMGDLRRKSSKLI